MASIGNKKIKHTCIRWFFWFKFIELQREGKALPQASLPFHRAMPSMTHMALVELEKAGILKFVISQVYLLYLIL